MGCGNSTPATSVAPSVAVPAPVPAARTITSRNGNQAAPDTTKKPEPTPAPTLVVAEPPPVAVTAPDLSNTTARGGTTETLNLAKKSIKDIDVKGKRVLMRCDFNVPLDKTTGAITNNQRILGAIPTIEYALESDAKAVILLSHMGRPNGFPSVLFPLSFL